MIRAFERLAVVGRLCEAVTAAALQLATRKERTGRSTAAAHQPISPSTHEHIITSPHHDHYLARGRSSPAHQPHISSGSISSLHCPVAALRHALLSVILCSSASAVSSSQPLARLSPPLAMSAGVKKDEALLEQQHALMDESTSTIVTHSPLHPPPPPLSSLSSPSSSSSSPTSSSSPSTPPLLVDSDSSTCGQLLLFGSASYHMMASIPLPTPSSNIYAPTPPPSLASTRISTISLGSTHALLTTDAGVTLSFGDNPNGELGLPPPTPSATPQPVPALSTKYVLHTAAGYSHSAAVSGRGELLTWGAGDLGQLGVNLNSTGIHRWDLSPHPTPTPIQQLAQVKVVKVVAGEDATIALSDQGVLYACGDAHRGTLGLEQGLTWNEDRHRVGIFTPVTALSPLPIIDVALGSHHTLALTVTGDVYTFGQGRRGQLGHGSTTNVFLPKRVEGLEKVKVVGVYAGGDASAVVSEEGELYVFGSNAHGQLGVGDNDSRYVPVRVKDGLEGKRVVKVAIGQSHMLVLCDDHTVLGMGDASLGVLGLGQKEQDSDGEGGAKRQKVDEEAGSSGYGDILSPTPVPLPPGRRVLDVSAGSTSSAVILSFATHVTPLPRIAFPPALSSYGVTHFDSATFSHLIDTSKQSSSYAALLAYINRIFSTPTVLNASFLPVTSLSFTSSLLQRQLSLSSVDPLVAATTLPNFLLSPTSRVSPPTIQGGIDVLSVEEVYKTILRESIAEPKLISQVSHAIHRCIHSLLDRMKQPHPVADAGAYRAVAICLQAPFLSAASAADVQVLADVAQVVSRMGVGVRKVVRRWLTSYSPEIFGSRLVKMIVNAITSQLHQQRLSLAASIPTGQPVPHIAQVSDEVQAMVRLLALMKEANDLAGGLISDERWYIPIIKFVSLEQDFIAFITRQPTQAMLPPFSFCRFPFTLDPPTKSAYLRLEHFSHQRASIYAALNSEQQPFVTLRIDRSKLVESTVNELNRHSAYELQRPLRIEFLGEEGIDQGGVSAEFFRLVVTELMGRQYGLFDYNEEMRHLWYNAEPADPSTIDLYYLTGTLFGLAAYNTHAINVSFPAVFYKQLLSAPIDETAATSPPLYSLADLHSLDPRLVQSLQQLLAYNAPDMEDLFQLSFTVDQQIRRRGKDGEDVLEIRTVELLEGGASTPVTQSNKVQYISLLTNFLLSASVAPQQQSFIRGFRSVCQGRAMSMFTPLDLQQLLIGQPVFDWKALKTSARYEGYTRDSEAVRWLWEVVEDEMSLEQKMKLLVFMTGSSRAPLGGLGELRVVVQRAGPDSEQMPTASTCYATLLLPQYSSKDKLGRKLRLAVEYSEGFGLQ